MISPEREHELAIEIGHQRTAHALERTPDAVVYHLIEGLEDIAPMSDTEIRQTASRIAALIRTGSASVVFPQLLLELRTGDRVRLVEPVGKLAIGCEGTVALLPDGSNEVGVNIDGYGPAICPRDAVQRIEA